MTVLPQHFPTSPGRFPTGSPLPQTAPPALPQPGEAGEAGEADMKQAPEPSQAADVKLVASISGGKDSSAVWLYLERELGLTITPIFQDTGWEHPALYRHLDYLEEVHGREIVRLVAQIPLPEAVEEVARGFEARLGRYSPMVRLILKKAMFPSRARRFCTQLLKVYPSAAFIQSQEDECWNVLGIRAAESLARAGLDPFEWSKAHDCWVWRPILDRSEDDVWAIHRRHGVKVCDLYAAGLRALGAGPASRPRKASYVVSVKPTRSGCRSSPTLRRRWPYSVPTGSTRIRPRGSRPCLKSLTDPSPVGQSPK